jgi:hypothetical protein
VFCWQLGGARMLVSRQVIKKSLSRFIEGPRVGELKALTAAVVANDPVCNHGVVRRGWTIIVTLVQTNLVRRGRSTCRRREVVVVDSKGELSGRQVVLLSKSGIVFDSHAKETRDILKQFFSCLHSHNDCVVQ